MRNPSQPWFWVIIRRPASIQNLLSSWEYWRSPRNTTGLSKQSKNCTVMNMNRLQRELVRTCEFSCLLPILISKSCMCLINFLPLFVGSLETCNPTIMCKRSWVFNFIVEPIFLDFPNYFFTNAMISFFQGKKKRKRKKLRELWLVESGRTLSTSLPIRV